MGAELLAISACIDVLCRFLIWLYLFIRNQSFLFVEMGMDFLMTKVGDVMQVA